MAATITNEDLAQIYDALGKPEQAELFRYLERPDPDALTVDELADSLRAAVSSVPEMASSAKHTDECWKKHAACLADRVLELLP
jgi:hypothetical protein